MERVDTLDNLIRQLQKMDSKLRSGQIIDAWRELNRIIVDLIQMRRKLIADTERECLKSAVEINDKKRDEEYTKNIKTKDKND